MRAVVCLLVGMIVVTCVLSQAAGGDKAVNRYRIDANREKYPQGEPQQALTSVVKALEAGQYEYLLAHLADPTFVDKRVEEYKAQIKQKLGDDAKTLLAFDRLANETRDHFKDDPGALKELQLFAKSGEWDSKEATAEAQLKSIPGRRVFLKKMDNRWYLEDRQK
jgi:hypothetical protein